MKNSELQELLDKNPEGLLVLDDKGLITYTNHTASSYLNKDPQELKGQKFPYSISVGDKKKITISDNNKDENLEITCTEISHSTQKFSLVNIKNISEYVNKFNELKQSIEELTTTNTYMEIVESLCTNIYDSLDIQTIFDNSVRLIVEKVRRADNALITLVKGNKAVIKSHRGYPEWFIDRIQNLTRERKSSIWHVIEDGKSHYQSDVNKDNYIGPAGIELGTKSYASIPIKQNRVVMGVLVVNSYSEDAFTDEEIKLFEDIRKHIELAIKRSRQHFSIKTTEARFNSFMSNMPGAAFIKNRELSHIYVNPS